MFRRNLSADAGMLFIYDSEGDYIFWMKNTLIPLDMIWLDSNLRVVHIETATPCQSDPCPTYDARANSKYILEVNGGYAKEHGISEGDAATFRKINA
jgi:uncharacterized membrane protein (UPF0127 family)